MGRASDGWIDDLRFYVLFNSISVISGRWEVDNEWLCAMELRLRLRRFRHKLLDQKASAKPTDLPVLPVHRKRGFITSANSDDTDQLLHLSSHISVFSIFASTRYHENHTF